MFTHFGSCYETLHFDVGDHCNATGHTVPLSNTCVAANQRTTVDQKKSERSYRGGPIRKEKCPVNEPRTGYQLAPIYHQLLLPEQFPRRKTSRDQDF